MLTRALLLLQAGTLAAGTVVAIGLSGAPAAPAVAAAADLPPLHGAREVSAPAVVPAVLPRAEIRPAPVHPKRRTARKVHKVVRAPRPVVPVAPPLSPQQRLDRVVARIPGYDGGATWITTLDYRTWGTADWYHGRIYISPLVPSARLYDVAVHEWSHLLSVRPYAGDVDAAMSAMNTWYGGRGLTGAERAADCMAKQLGAQWTHYTACTDPHWQDGARRLIAGHQLS